MNRVIVHADLNHCYAQIEEMMAPSLREVPMAVGGREESRHGIILAKNDLAKAAGVKTAETLRDALRKCPELLIIHPHYEDYVYYTEMVKDIYREYTDQVESFGLDEAWFDLSRTVSLFGDPVETARTIQERVFRETGLSVSMGVSFNKIFAKLGSDMDKKRGFTVITPESFREQLKDLPVEDLLYVGRATAYKLNACGIRTIGQLADADIRFLKRLLGKNGEMIWYFANGWEGSEVKDVSWQREVKSVGNGVTAIHDLHDFTELQLVLRVLSDSVAARLRQKKKRCSLVTLYLRDKDLRCFSHQRKFSRPTDLSEEILSLALFLAHECCPAEEDVFPVPYRSVTITAGCLSEHTYCEYDLFGEEAARQKQRSLEVTIEKIRGRYGPYSLRYGSALQDDALTSFDPLGEHTIHPESWF
ncbi:MAG: DNA polymerase IV [Erysipelotrichaceae bacterium]|nr:DNA polymerase IV [Erysipelotrichaceae bacterium]